jgi:hypothetical protein
MQPNHSCGDDRGVVSGGGRTGLFARHRQRPVSSTSSQKLSKALPVLDRGAICVGMLNW